MSSQGLPINSDLIAKTRAQIEALEELDLEQLIKEGRLLRRGKRTFDYVGNASLMPTGLGLLLSEISSPANNKTRVKINDQDQLLRTLKRLLKILERAAKTKVS